MNSQFENTFLSLKQSEKVLNSYEEKISEGIKQIDTLSNYKHNLNVNIFNFLKDTFSNSDKRFKNTMFENLYNLKSDITKFDRDKILTEINNLINSNPDKKILIFTSDNKSSGEFVFNTTVLDKFAMIFNDLSDDEIRRDIDFTKYHTVYETENYICLIGIKSFVFGDNIDRTELISITENNILDIDFVDIEFWLNEVSNVNHKPYRKSRRKVQFPLELINMFEFEIKNPK